MQASDQTLLALDIGERRIGVATAKAGVGFAHPLTTIAAGDTAMDEIQRLVERENVGVVIAGMPRGLEGQRTKQTEFVEEFITTLKSLLKIPVYTVDEALTSVKAEAELDARGKAYNKADVDALAATYILEDFMSEHSKEYYAS